MYRQYRSTQELVDEDGNNSNIIPITSLSNKPKSAKSTRFNPTPIAPSSTDANNARGQDGILTDLRPILTFASILGLSPISLKADDRNKQRSKVSLKSSKISKLNAGLRLAIMVVTTIIHILNIGSIGFGSGFEFTIIHFPLLSAFFSGTLHTGLQWVYGQQFYELMGQWRSAEKLLMASPVTGRKTNKLLRNTLLAIFAIFCGFGGMGGLLVSKLV